MPTETEILAALANIAGPDGRTPLPKSGAIDGVTQRDGKVFIAIRVDPAKAPSLEPMKAAVESAVKSLPGRHLRPGRLSRPSSLPAQSRKRRRKRPRHMRIAAPSAGDPSRASTRSSPSPRAREGSASRPTACNLAIGLGKLGLKVGVLDADVFGPSMPRLFGIGEKPALAPDGQKLLPIERFGVKVMSIGFLVEENSAIVWRGPMVTSALNQFLRDVDWGKLDVLVIDMPPGTGDVQLTIAQNAPLAGAVIVSTPQDLSLIDARRAIAMFKQVETPVLGIVENMSYFICPHCGGRSDVFAHGGARHEAEKQGVPFLGEAPLHMLIRETSDGGAPVVASAPDSPQAKAYVDIAEKVRTALFEPARKRMLPRIFMS